MTRAVAEREKRAVATVARKRVFTREGIAKRETVIRDQVRTGTKAGKERLGQSWPPKERTFCSIYVHFATRMPFQERMSLRGGRILKH